jgi:hypothetical protein
MIALKKCQIKVKNRKSAHKFYSKKTYPYFCM